MLRRVDVAATLELIDHFVRRVLCNALDACLAHDVIDRDHLADLGLELLDQLLDHADVRSL